MRARRDDTARWFARSTAARRSPRLVIGGLLFGWLLLGTGAVGAQEWVYTARPGDNLWNLTGQYLRSFRYAEPLRELNGIEEPRRIRPGTKIRMPIAWLKVKLVPAEVTQVQGDVHIVIREGEEKEPAVVGDELRSGDRLLTGEGAVARIRFADGSELFVRERSEVVMDSLSAYGDTGMVDTQMRLRSGRVENTVERLKGPAARYRIDTPAAIAAVRGTRYRVAAREDTTLSEVLEGTVGLSSANVTRSVPAGFGAVARAGEPPGEPVPLPAAPDLSGLPAVQDRLQLAFAWPAVPGAVTYRLQLLGGEPLAELLADRILTVPQLLLDAPPDGRYAVRVRAIDGQGLEGADAERRFEVDARPVPPSLLQPADGYRTHDQVPRLWWSIPAGIERFELEIATDAAFGTSYLRRTDLTGSRLELPELPEPGDYYWRMASRSGTERGPFSEPRHFRILAVPPAVAADAPAVGEEAVSFTWRPAPLAERYHFQLARDEAFEEPIVDETLAETRYTLPRPAGGTYFFRVRAVSAEGVPGPAVPNRMDVPGDGYWPFLIFAVPLLIPLL